MIGREQDSGLSLRVSVTDRCQLRCLYCVPMSGIAPLPRAEILTYEEIAAFVRYLKEEFGLSKARITGGDPLVRRDIETLVRMLADVGLPDLAMTTNAQRLAPKASLLKAAGLRRVNISLDSLKAATFERLSGGGSLRKTQQGIEAALAHDLRPVKLNMVVLRGVNDDEVAAVLAFALQHGCEARFLELMPLGPASANFRQWFVSAEEIRARLSASFSLSARPVPPGTTARDYLVTDAAGRRGVTGFIAPHSQPFCAGCARLRLTADGQLIGCLGRERRVAIKPLLRGAQAERAGLAALVEGALLEKTKCHQFAPERAMVAIGG